MFSLCRPGWLPRIAVLAIAMLGISAGAVAAREVTVTGSQTAKFARILLQFDQRTKVTARAANGVLVIRFADPSRVVVEKLAAELPPYISSVRRDPDETGLRLALVGPFQLNVLEAGERVYIDLLPMNWVGLPPGLPPEVVAELAERARAAEERLRAEAERKAEPPQRVALRVAELPAITRFVFEPPAGTAIQVRDVAGQVEATLSGALVLDLAGTKPKLAAGVRSFTAAPAERSMTIRVGAQPGYTARGFVDDGTLVIDLKTPAAAERVRLPDAPVPRPADATPPKPMTEIQAVDPKVQAAAVAGDGKQVVAAVPQVAIMSAGPTPDASAAPARALIATQPAVAPSLPRPPPAPVTPVVDVATESVSLKFPFKSRTPAAAFQNASGLVLVFDTSDPLQPVVVPEAARQVVRIESMRQEDRFAVVRVALPEPRAMRFEPDGNGWRLILGGRDALPPDALKLSRGVDENGSGVVAIDMHAASAAFWLQDGPGGAPMAVVTAFGRPQGLPNAMSFVEFGLPATLQGVVVEARADDLTVALANSGVVISRKSGLSLSPASPSQGLAAAVDDGPVLSRERWLHDQAGDVYARYKEHILAATNAPRPERAAARFEQARFLVANGMNQEAAGVLAVARADDPAFARRTEVQLLSGIASFRAGRLREAKSFLTADGLAEDREAILWRAMLDARQRRPAQAAAGFRRAERTLALYAEDLAGTMRLSAFRTMLEANDVPAAEGQLTAIDQLPTEVVPHDVHDLARARLEEAQGRNAAALAIYGRLIEEGQRPIWAEATLRDVVLSTRSGSGLSPEDAIQRLEVLAAAWRGDEIELETLLELSRLYGKTGRWRDAFGVMRRASRAFPAHDLTRVLHDETSLLFEKLFLGDLGDVLSSVETLGLYFDFRELAPVGRRGDEIVRRLADRLVDLDLLDQATELLQHQVDKRLSGTARAAVAARLAAVQLLNGKPALALTALHNSRIASLPEEVRQFRTLLEAETHAELSRTDLALETLEGETGLVFDRLRMNIQWRARRWREAGGAAEALVGLRWEGPQPLSERDRSDILRAAIAYSLADEALDLGRIRSKFGAKMADSPDATMFTDVLRPDAAQTREFRAAALKVSKADSLRSLLADWKAEHPGTVTEPVTPAPRAEPAAAAMPPKQARSAEAAPPG